MTAVVRRRATIRDVATRSGVSVKTVSRVLNDEKGVAAPTARRVLDAVGDLGYRRNDLARSLKRDHRSDSLGLIVGDITNPFYAAVTAAAEEAARRAGYLLVTASAEEDPERERRLLGALIERRMDGLLITPAPGSDHGWLVPEQQLGMPIVFVDREPVGCPADVVLLDNVGGARQAVAHLLSRGHRRIAIVGDDARLPTAAARLSGFHAGHADAGVAPDETLVRLGHHDAAQAEAATHVVLAEEDPPTAVFTTNNRSTVGALRAIRGSGAPVALIGFDDFELADMVEPPVSVVSYDPRLLGRVAMETLLRRVRGDAAPSRRIVLPTTLVVRRSSEVH